MERNYITIQEAFQSHHARPIFGLCQAPVLPTAAREDNVKGFQGHNRGHLTEPPQSLVHRLHRALVKAQDTIEKLTCENIDLRQQNTRLSLEQPSISEDLEELRSLYTEVEKEKEAMVDRIMKMEKDFQNDKKIWQSINRQQLGETRSFRNELLVAQTLRDHMQEEVRDYKRELQECRKQVEREIASLEESLHLQREENTARLSAMEDHYREVIRIGQFNATTKLRDSEEKWQRRVNQLEEEVKESRRVVQSELCQSEEKWERKCKALEYSHRKELAEREQIWQKRVQYIERKYQLEKMWLQKEKEWREKTRALEEEIERLTKEGQDRQKKRKPWWRRRFKFRRRQRRNTVGTSGETV